jgi:hypothetical protein
LVNSFRPNKRFGVLFVVLDIILNGFNEITDALETATSNPFTSNLSKPSLHQIQPRRTCRCEVKMEARMAFEPGLHFGVFVCRVIVYHQVKLSLLGSLAINLA